MIDPVFTVDSRDVLAHFDRLPRELRDHLVARLGPVDDRMLAIVRAGAPVRTGRLRSEIQGNVASGDTFVRARVFVAGTTQQDFGKAGALEFGIPGISARSISRAPGGSVRVKAYVRRRGESVRAYRHRMRIEARRFLRRAITAMQAQGTAAIELAVDETVIG